VVASVNPTCANAGTQFVINGSGFYPSLVKSVLIGGTPLDPSQYTTTSDSEITVVAPEQSGESLSVIVVTTQGQSTGNVTIEISVIDICGL
jgi:IPT/TIG domain-containing protein